MLERKLITKEAEDAAVETLIELVKDSGMTETNLLQIVNRVVIYMRANAVLKKPD